MEFENFFEISVRIPWEISSVIWSAGFALDILKRITSMRKLVLRIFLCETDRKDEVIGRTMFREHQEVRRGWRDQYQDQRGVEGRAGRHDWCRRGECRGDRRRVKWYDRQRQGEVHGNVREQRDVLLYEILPFLSEMNTMSFLQTTWGSRRRRWRGFGRREVYWDTRRSSRFLDLW